MRMKPLLPLLLLIVPLSGLMAQVPPDVQRGEEEEEQSLEQLDVLLDTFDIFYFYADNPKLEIPYADTTLGNYYRQYDPTRQRRLDYRNLGILGSAHEPIVYEAVDRRGFEMGLDQFELYTIPTEDLAFYRLEQPFSKFNYTLGSEQADSYTKAKFSRNFANGINFTLDYARITQFGENSQYPNQNNRNTAFTNGLWYQSPNSRYEGFLTVASNTIEQEDNGGVRQEPVLEGEFTSPSAAVVFLGDARTRHQHRAYAYQQYYRFGGGRDSIRGIRRSYTLGHKVKYKSSLYKYADDYNPAADSNFYNLFPALLADPRGVRFYLQHRQLENEFRLATFKLGATSGEQATKQRDLLSVGAVHTAHWVQQANADTSLNNLFLTGRYRFNPNPKLLIDLDGRFGLWDNAGDYRLRGRFFFDFGKVGQLELEGINQLYSPTLMQHRLYLSERQVYRNNFDKTLATSLKGRYRIPGIQLSVEGRYHLLNNYTYFGTDGLPRQTGVPVSLGQLIVEKDFALFWNLHLDNLIALQQSSEEVLRLPAFFGKHSFYYAGKWFRVLNVRLGVDLRYNDSFFANYYNPVTGQFQLQDRREVEFYPAADAFFSMRVTKRFRAFVRWENGTATMIDDFFYQTAFYPHPRAVVRIGIDWRFLN